MNPYDCTSCHNEGYDHAPDCPFHPVNLARQEFNQTPWWRPFRRQEAARRYRFALLEAAMKEGRWRP